MLTETEEYGDNHNGKKYRIPLEYKERIYNINELSTDPQNILELNYSDYGDIITYDLPDSEYTDEIRLYNIPKKYR